MVVGHDGIYAGGAHQALYAIRGLLKAGVEVGAIWGEDAEADRGGFKRLKDLGIPFWVIPVHRRATISSLFAVRKVLREFKPDIVEAVKTSAQYNVLIAGWGMKFGLVFFRGISRPLDKWQGWKYRLKKVRRVIANCHHLKGMMINDGLIPADKIDVIPGEFDPSCSDPDRVDARGLREELKIPTNIPIISQLGNFAPWRGQDVTLQAAAILAQNGMRFHLIFAGRETEKLLPLVKKLSLEKVVTLSRYRRDPERLLKESSITVNASTGNENLSGAILNAQAMGVPAVITALAGADEAVEDGITGFIVPPRDPSAFAEAIGTLLQMSPAEYQKMRRASRSRALKLFSSEERAKLRIKCYQNCLTV